MKTIEAMIVVDADGKAIIQLPAEIGPELHRVTVTLGEALAPVRPFRVDDLPRHDIPWPFAADEAFHREDLYGDHGQ